MFLDTTDAEEVYNELCRLLDADFDIDDTEIDDLLSELARRLVDRARPD